MSRRLSLWLLSTVAVLVLAFGYRTSTGSDAAANTFAVVASPTALPVGASSGAAALNGTFTGAVAWTVRGPLQVKVTITNGAITAVDVPVHPSGHPRDRELNSYALPLLEQETVAAQGAAVDTISGATVTSKGYQQSLQSALDAAHRS